MIRRLALASPARAALLGAVVTAACAPAPSPGPGGAPAPELVGEFEDDYGNRYEIGPERWLHRPDIVYHIVAWDTVAMTLIARNDADNPSEPGLWTRIDWVALDDMAPWRWAYCLTVYDAPTREAAETAAPADRASPRDGCNGFPFSRMRRVDTAEDERQVSGGTE